VTDIAAMRCFGHRFSTMGCPAAVRVYAENEAAAQAAFAIAESECRRLDLKYSHYRADSYLSDLLQQAARPEGTIVDEETAALLNLAATQYSESHGLFDLTAGRLTELWRGRSALPDTVEIAAALALTGWRRVEWDGSRLRIPAGMRLDPGGIVKEYAADRAAVLLKSAGFPHGYVDLGGDLHVLGPHADGRPWNIGISNPRGLGAVASISLERGGLATSGDYERCSFIDGARYSHIVNPVSGWPVRGLATVSVVAATCLLAGAVSTLAMLMETQESLHFLAETGLAWLAHDGNATFAGHRRNVEPAGTHAVQAVPGALHSAICHVDHADGVSCRN